MYCKAKDCKYYIFGTSSNCDSGRCNGIDEKGMCENYKPKIDLSEASIEELLKEIVKRGTEIKY